MASVRRAPATPSGDPNVAAFLTWFLPGAGHVYLGRAASGLLAFGVVGGLYLLGLALSQGMGFEFLQAELRGPLAPVLAPEAGNLGGLLWQMRQHGYGPGYPRPWPEWIALGTTLTAVSGVLNVCLMVQAHSLARLPKGAALAARRSPAFFAFLAWLAPGLGHLAQGRRRRAILVGGSLLLLLLLGTLLAEGSNLDRERHYYYWGGQVLAGAPALLLEWIHGHGRISGEIAFAEAGLVFGCLAGLLNVLAMIDVYGASERQVFGAPEAENPEPVPEPAPDQVPEQGSARPTSAREGRA